MQVKKNILFLLLFFITGIISAQNLNPKHLSYNEIEEKIDSLHNDPDKIWFFINLYIQKSKEELNYETLVYAYRYASNYSEYPKNLKYADSALLTGKKSQSQKLLADAYLNRGIIFMKEELYNRALDDILVANNYAVALHDEYNTYKTIYYIAQNKKFLGLYEDANRELEICLTNFKRNLKNKDLGKNYEMYYLYSLMSYIDSNIKLGKNEQNKALFAEAFEYCKKENLQQYTPYFISLEGTEAYFRKDYPTAISQLTKALKDYNDPWPHLTEIYYLGQTYWKTGKRSLGVKYLEEIDEEYNKTKKLDPQFRSAYEVLIKYSDSVGDKSKQLEYINKLMSLDKIYEKNFKYLYPKINKEYDTQKLIEEKAAIEKSLSYQKMALIATVIISLLVILFNVLRYYRLTKKYKKRFDDIMREMEAREQEEKISASQENSATIIPEHTHGAYNYNKIPGMNPLFVENILNQLDEFEKEHKFLNPQLSQKLLSEKMGTNSTYFSKIINTYKGKNFNFYINDLKLDYIIHLLKTDIKYLNSDVKELAQIAGFTSAESFSDNFQRKFKIKPSYFIKMLKEERFKTSAQSHSPASDEENA